MFNIIISLTGKTYFFKGKGYWQFDDMRMRVAHDQQKKSAYRWMGCHERLDDEETSHERRHNNWNKNSKLNEEIEDVNNDEEDMYFDFESTLASVSTASNLDLININKILIIFVVTLLNAMNLDLRRT